MDLFRILLSSILYTLADIIAVKKPEPIPPEPEIVTYRYACSVFSKDNHAEIVTFLNNLNSNIEDIHAVQMDVNYVLIITKIIANSPCRENKGSLTK